MRRYNAIATFYVEGGAIRMVGPNGEDIKIVYLERDGRSVRLGIEAPRELDIQRIEDLPKQKDFGVKKYGN